MTDDIVLPFTVDPLDLRGRVVRLGPANDTMLARHDYPAPVSRLLAEAVALTLLLGTALKFDGRFIFQTRSDGPVSMLVVDLELPDKVRACARLDKDAVAAAIASGKTSPVELLGKGHLAMTIDTGRVENRYQGVVALEGEGLEAAAHTYFRQSEQIPTRLRLAGGELMSKGAGRSHWRAGGLLVQHFPEGAATPRDLPPGDAPQGFEEAERDDDDRWVEAVSLVDTLEDHELTDPGIAAGTVLRRLFNEHDTAVFDPLAIREECRCSHQQVKAMLA
ncbi:MAG: Hsp33 family molecular chaperone, partial [Hyphomicrobiales bacterium]|nr:Hsp33 family molecular chaperone [Hyphomicrobiales bacterium]